MSMNATIIPADHSVSCQPPLSAEGLAVGRLAHDLRNVLQIVTGNLSLLVHKFGDDLDLRRHVDAAMAGMRSAELLVGSSVDAARGSRRRQVVQVGDLLDAMASVLEGVAGPNVQVEVRTSSSIPVVETDPAQLESAILNLVLNACQAMEDRGDLTIHVLPEVAKGRLFVDIIVSDTGCGMTEEVLARVTEPFFTTKGRRGTGLGLASARTFVEQSGGSLHVASRPGEGTSVTLRIPAARTRRADAHPHV